jgi:hypothetical protein
MAKLLKDVCENLKSNRGETIVESIVSLFILTLLMGTVLSIINSSFQMTNGAMARSEVRQNLANELVRNPGAGGTAGTLKLLDGGIVFVSIAVDITTYEDGAFTAFAP